MTTITPKNWKQQWDKEYKEALASLSNTDSLDLEKLEAIRLKYLGRKGSLTDLLKSLKDLSIEDRRELGGPANQEKESFSQQIDNLKNRLGEGAREQEILATQIDLTLPGASQTSGHIHPLTQTMEEMASILERLGFAWAEGPLIETDYYNFEALNIPPEHSSRDMFDTFYLKIGSSTNPPLLRTHTSPVQIRKMESQKPPLRVISPGRVFRHEAVDASHSAVFHQIEGLYVDRRVTLADLKSTLNTFLQTLFGAKTKTRFRPSYFPFTEPSAEMDVQCLFCSGAGCNICKRSGWLEILGSGLVHRNVLKAVGYDPDACSGFAFGVGVERIAMLRLGIPDIRFFYQNDVRFLEQF